MADSLTRLSVVIATDRLETIRHVRSYHEARARVDHLNVASRIAWAHERFLGGRLLGAARRARWSRS